LEVVIESLDEAGAQLDRLSQEVADVWGRPTWSGAADGAGSPVVGAAIDSFIRRWGYGVACLETDLSQLAGSVRAAATAYRMVEAWIVAGAGGGAG
jgi:hypothetical protein